MQFHQGLARNPGRLYRHQIIKNLVISNSRDESKLIVDMGCGTGELLSYLARDIGTQNLLGLDISKVGILKAQEKFPNLNFGLIEINEFDSNSRSIQSRADIIVCSEVLEHLEKPELILKFISNNLASSGTLIVTVPGGPMSFLEEYIGHHRHYSKESLTDLLEDSGFQGVEIHRAGFPGINLIRLVSILRGSRILNDISESQKDSILLKLGFRIAELILKCSFKDSKFGWQLIAVCHQMEPTNLDV
jgi:SAM-dependent methyltransferase